MKTVKIYLATSEELQEECTMFGDFINGIRRAFKSQGIDLELVKWDYIDSDLSGVFDEEKFANEVKDCLLFVALFHTEAPKFTQQELGAARRSLKAYNVPSIFIFIKDLTDGKKISQDLETLMVKILDEWKHFNDKFNHPDTLKYRFLQQLIIKLNDPSVRLEVEDSVISLNNTAVANLDNVPFAANNDHFKKLKDDIADANKKIEAYEQVLAAAPNPVIDGLLNEEKRRRATLCEELSKYEKDLFATSQHIASLKNEVLNDRLRRAIELFESGDNKGADALLDMKDIRRDIEWIKRDAEAARDNARAIISQLTLKAQNLLTIYDNPNRIAEADEAYAEALDTAKSVRIDDKEIVDLLGDYHKFLSNYALYDKALTIGEKWLRLARYVYGEEHQDTGMSYNNIGLIYYSLGDYNKASEYYLRAIEIQGKVLGKEHPYTATSYNNIGLVYKSLGDYNKALAYFFKALEIEEKVFGQEHPSNATSYNNIGLVYSSLGDYNRALEYHFKALEIREKELGEEHPDITTSYNNIGRVYSTLSDYDKALKYYFKALEIQEKVLGTEHPYTAISYNNIGLVCSTIGDYDKAREYIFKSLEIVEKVLGKEHPYTATSYNNIGLVCHFLGDYDKALEYFFKVLEIREKVLPANHPNIGVTLYNIAREYEEKSSMEEALRYMRRACELGDGDARLWLQEHGETTDSLN